MELAKGWGGFVVLHLAWRKDSLSTHVDTRVEPRKFRKRGATWKWRATPCRPSKWFNESRQAWDWIWLWRLCCRQRTVVTCRTRDIEGKCQRWREGEEKGEFSSSANLPKLSWNVPPYDVASSRETVIESHVSYFSRV